MATTIMGYTTQNKIRFLLPVTGLTHTSTGLIISTINNNESTPVVYTAAANNIETITTLGTFANPTSGKCRFREVSATNHPGLYEFHIADARFAANGDRLVISVSGAAGLPALGVHYEIDLLAHANVRAWLGIIPASLNDTYVQTRVMAMDNDVVTSSAIAANAIGASELASDAAGEIATSVRSELATELGRVDANVSSRMATYTQPTGFLAATFPTTVASPTNITSASGVTLAATTHTGAVIPTVTSVTNSVVLPSSASINIIGNITGNISGSVGSVTGNVGGNVIGSVGSVLSGVTITTNNDKTGYSLVATTGLGNQIANITGNLSGSVGSVTGSVGSVTNGVTVTTNNDKTGYSLANASITNSTFSTGAIDAAAIATDAFGSLELSAGAAGEIADAIWDELTSGHTVNGSYGERILRSTNSQASVAVTGSHHVAADIHELQPGVIIDADFDSNSTYAKLSTLIEADPVSGWRYTVQALEQAPIDGECASAEEIAEAVRDELTPELEFIDAPISSVACTQEGISASQNDVCGTTLRSYYGETRTFEIDVNNVNGSPYDFTGLDLIVCIEKDSGVNLEVITNESITVSGNIVTFQTSVANNSVGQHRWSLRRSDTDVVILFGDYVVRRAALA